MQQVFGVTAGHPGFSPQQMQWKYWRSSSDWEGSRSFVMDQDGRIVAHGAVVPLAFASSDHRLKLVNVIDWAALPDSAGAGITLMRRIGEMCDGIFAAGGSEITQQILPVLGFQQVGTASNFVRSLHLRPKVGSDLLQSWKPAARLARDAVRKVNQGTSIVPANWNVRELSLEELRTSEFPTPKPLALAGVFTRNSSQIVDLLQCPAALARFYLVVCDGKTRGYFVLTFVRKEARIAESWVDSPSVENWQALFALAAQAAKTHKEAADLLAVASLDVEIQALKQAGFRLSGTTIPRASLRNGRLPSTVRYQMVDGDAAYLNT